MTLEDAKAKIGTLMEFYWVSYCAGDEEHPEWRGSPYIEGKSDGLEEALDILKEVDG